MCINVHSSEHPQLTEEIVGPQLPAGDHQNADFASPVVAKVRSILEQSAELGAAAGLLSSFSEQQQQQLTTAVLQLSGVELQGSGAAVCTEESFPSLSALYAALHALHCLVGAGGRSARAD